MLSSQKFAGVRKTDEKEEEQNRQALQSIELEFSQQKGSTLFIKGGVLDPTQKMAEQEKGDMYLITNKQPDTFGDVIIKSLNSGGNLQKTKNMDMYLNKLKQRHQTNEKPSRRQGEQQNQESQKQEVVDQGLSHEIAIQILEAVERQTPFYLPENEQKIIYISGLTPKINEIGLRQVCQKYGDIESVNIKSYYTNDSMVQITNSYQIIKKARINGYVQFKNESSAKSALEDLQKRVSEGLNFQVMYGQLVQNRAIMTKKDQLMLKDSINRVKISLPDNYFVKRIIDRLAKLVSLEGYQMEKYIKEKEQNNPYYAFLFYQGPEQEYYKWKVYSFLNETQDRPQFFQYQIGNTIYQPPSLLDEQEQEKNFQGQVDKGKKDLKGKKLTLVGNQLLSQDERLKFETILSYITLNRTDILNAMVFCMDRTQYSADLTLIITRSIVLQGVTTMKKLARLYLISDILHNSQIPPQVGSYWTYNVYFKSNLPIILEALHESIQKGTSVELELFKDKVHINLLYNEQVSRLLKVWKDWGIYEINYIQGLEQAFLVGEYKEMDNPLTQHGLNEIDGEPLTPSDIRLIEEHKVQVISYHDIRYLFKDAQKPSNSDQIDEVQLQVQEYQKNLVQAQIYSEETLKEMIQIKEIEILKQKGRGQLTKQQQDKLDKWQNKPKAQKQQSSVQQVLTQIKLRDTSSSSSNSSSSQDKKYLKNSQTQKLVRDKKPKPRSRSSSKEKKEQLKKKK